MSQPPRAAGLSIALSLLLAGVAGHSAPAAHVGAPALYGYRVVNVYPHDPRAFTQGLVFVDGALFESTGLHGRSTLRKVTLETGLVVQHQIVEPRYFAEGLTDWRGTLVQLTYQSGLGFVYDRATFKRTRTFSYASGLVQGNRPRDRA
jgi:glutaminyl-peptide cyclotransferase